MHPDASALSDSARTILFLDPAFTDGRHGVGAERTRYLLADLSSGGFRPMVLTTAPTGARGTVERLADGIAVHAVAGGARGTIAAADRLDSDLAAVVSVLGDEQSAATAVEIATRRCVPWVADVRPIARLDDGTWAGFGSERMRSLVGSAHALVVSASTDHALLLAHCPELGFKQIVCIGPAVPGDGPLPLSRLVGQVLPSRPSPNGGRPQLRVVSQTG